MKDLQNQVRDLYAGLWGNIDSIRSEAIIEQFLSNVSLEPEWFVGKQCLEIGAGSGFAVWAMDHLGASCTACDISLPSLRDVQSRLKDCDPGGRLAAASALQLPYATGSFDFVHCNGVLHHTLDPRQGFSEFVRVARPGGTVFVSLYGRGGLYNLVVGMARIVAHVVPYSWGDRFAQLIFGDKKLPNSFMPAKISFLDNAYVPIRSKYTEREIREWFAQAGFDLDQVFRTKTTIYDHTTALNRMIHGEGYLQFRAVKPRN
jgi:ubiquinone/menaquinone biosynthesis C-methylase UbiE